MILHLAGDKLCCTELSLTLFLQTVIARCTFFPVDLGISRAGTYLKPLLVQIANALIKSKKHPEFRVRYQRIKARRGHKKAIIAICRMLLTAIWNVLSKKEPYSPDGFLQPLSATQNKILTKAQGLELLRQRGFIIKDDPPDAASA